MNDEARKLFEELDNWIRRGNTIVDNHTRIAVQAGLARSLTACGREAEGNALAESLLTRCGYYSDRNTLNREKRLILAAILAELGRKREAASLKKLR